MPFTLSGPCEYREEIRKSRFMALAAPIANAEEARAFIAAHSDPSASHNCWAWKCGSQYRFSDDGEPGGTAGRPMLTAIEGQDCDQVVVLVIRWFGGIPLGTGGLARAYGGCAARCLQGGQRIEQIPAVQAHCQVPFADQALARARLGEFAARIEQEQFDAQGVYWQLRLPAECFEALARRLSDLSRGQILLQRRQA